MKIVLIGGHLAPALSVIQNLPKETKILFIGRKYSLEGDKALSLEYKTITGLNIPFVTLNTGRLQRKLTRHTLPSLLKLPLGIAKALLILVKFRPDVVAGFGGYVSIPVVLCAHILRIPVVIHEQTLEAGLANKILSRFATNICISWDSSRIYFPKEKTILTGNPIRQMENGKWKMENPEGLPIIYITGGSLGSHFINLLVEGCIKNLLEKYIVMHQTGDAQEFSDFDNLKQIKNLMPAKFRTRYILKKFIEPSEIGGILSLSSLVISRSGINTITELIHFEKPALLIPLPFSQNNEQLKNAKFLKEIGLAEIFQQKFVDSQKLLQAIYSMFKNINNYKIKKDKKDLQPKNAAENIVKIINYVAKVKT